MRTTIVAALSLVSSGVSTAAFADFVVYDNTSGGHGTNIGQVGTQGGTGGDQNLGELITLTASGNLASITVGLPWVTFTPPAAAGSFNVTVYTNNGGTLGTPLETLFGTSTVQYSSSLNTFAFATAVSTAHPLLSSGQSYWFVVDGSTNSGLMWQGVQGQPNVPGVQFFGTGGGGNYFTGPQGSLIVNDLSPVPLPAAGWLLLSALGGLAALRAGNPRSEAR
jgi:hypothetical protein